ncbi:MAG TPA: S9 family peptidase [Pyrinomonadaceae bacterium]
MLTRGLYRRLLLVALLVQLTAPALVGVGARDHKGDSAAWSPELSLKVKTVGPVRVSPDGRRVAYNVTAPVMTADRSELVAQIHVANTDGTDNFQLTFAEKTSNNPQWSPDSRRLAFASTRNGKNNLYLLRLSGGEAEQLTDTKSAVGAFAWSPDGKWIAYTMTDMPGEEEEKQTKGRDDWKWVEENVKLSRLYVLPVERDADGKRPARRLTAADYNIGELDWSPDGKSIVYSHSKSPKADYWTTLDVSVVDVQSGQSKTLAATPAAEYQPLFSPDGKWVALSVTDNPPRWARSVTLHVVPVGGGAAKALPATFDGQPNLVGWSADGRQLYYNEARGTGSRLYALNVGTGAITELEKGADVFGAFDLNEGGTWFGFTSQSSERAPEAFVTRVGDFKPVQVSRANADLALPPLGKTEVVRWKSTDGKEIEGLLTYPVGYAQGRRVPLLLNVHGGPAGVFQQTFIGGRGSYPIATVAARGYAVLRPNPRGSSGYGVEFRRANIKDWGGMDYQDLMTGVDHVVKMGVADPERLGVMGWSYGGYMTSWIITQTKRFKAASAGAPVTNLMSFTGTADIPGFIPDYFGAQPWDDLDTYRKHSPMFNVRGVTTPTLIQHGDADERVPVSQGYELYNALRAQNVPVRMLVLPRQPHGPNEPRMILKVMQTNLEWFDKYLKNGTEESRGQ